MNCKNFDDFGSLYIDQALSEEERLQFEAHLENCEECRMKLRNLQLIVESINEIEEVDLPDNFSASLREKLEKIEHQKTEKKHKWLNRRFYTTVAAGLLVGVVATAMLTQGNWNMGSTKSNDSAPAEMPEMANPPQVYSGARSGRDGENSVTFDAQDAKPEMEAVEEETQFNFSTTLATDEPKAKQERKLIEEGNLSIETDQYDQAYSLVMELIETHGGYVEQEESYYHLIDRENPDSSLKSTSMSIRIPSESFRTAFEALKATGMVVNQNTNAKDITLQYADIENEALNLEVQETRLREILQQADQIEDILKIEQELNRVRTQINQYRGTLKNYDQLVSLSTIRLDLREVGSNIIRIQSTNQGVWSKAVEQMVYTVNQMIYVCQVTFIRLFGLLPLLMVMAVLGVPLGLIIYKKTIKRRNEK